VGFALPAIARASDLAGAFLFGCHELKDAVPISTIWDMKLCKLENSAESRFVILGEAKDFPLTRAYEILRSRRSLKMTGVGSFIGV
jgi:hypothetical protein